LGDGKYLVRFKTTNAKTGNKSEHKHIVKAKSAGDAAKRRGELQAELANEEATAERVRLSTFIDTWLISKKPELAPSTFDRYVRTLANHVLCKSADGVDLPGYPLGEYFLDAITHADIIKWRAAQQGEPSSVNSRLRILKTALADATIEHRLSRSPADRVQALPEIGYCDEEPNSLTAEQLAAWLDAVLKHSPSWYALFATLAFTGARVGEVTALKWDDIEEGEGDELGTILIRRSHWRGRVRASTKNDTWRRVPMPGELAAILAKHRRELEERDDVNLSGGWVFPNSTKGRRGAQAGSTPTLHSSVRNALVATIKRLEKAAAEQAAKAGLPPPESPLPHFTVHGLRRTMNNLLRQTVQDKTVVRAVIGHVTDKMTEHYSHVARDEKASAVSNVVSLVRRRGAKASVEVEAPVEVGASRCESGV
jgi:integrase